MCLREMFNAVLTDMLRKHLSNTKGIPDQRSSCELVVEGVSTVDDRSKFYYMRIENVTANLSAYV